MVSKYRSVKIDAAKTEIRWTGQELKRTVNEIRSDLDALNTERREGPIIKKYSKWNYVNDLDEAPF